VPAGAGGCRSEPHAPTDRRAHRARCAPHERHNSATPGLRRPSPRGVHTRIGAYNSDARSYAHSCARPGLFINYSLARNLPPPALTHREVRARARSFAAASPATFSLHCGWITSRHVQMLRYAGGRSRVKMLFTSRVMRPARRGIARMQLVPHLTVTVRVPFLFTVRRAS
jgi:hypothetical protein